MTSPANTDTPVASVPYGPSEIAAFLAMLASFANATFGHDYGLSQNSQAISALVAGLIPVGIGIFRAIKHHGAMGANALVVAKQLELGATAVAAARAATSPASVDLPAPAVTVVPHPLDGVPASSSL